MSFFGLTGNLNHHVEQSIKNPLPFHNTQAIFSNFVLSHSKQAFHSSFDMHFYKETPLCFCFKNLMLFWNIFLKLCLGDPGLYEKACWGTGNLQKRWHLKDHWSCIPVKITGHWFRGKQAEQCWTCKSHHCL